MVFNESGPLHDTLNPKLWDKDMNLLPEVREKINLIVDNFVEFISKYKSDEFKFRPLDINLVGSNASYNYNDKSDLDVSVVINFDMLGTSDEIADDYFHCKKNEFNSTYNPKIRGIDVELYISDQKSVNISNGVFSVKYNKWIKKPVKLTPPKNMNISTYIDELEKASEKTIEEGNLEALERLIDSIYLMRRNSLIVNGEFGRGNLIYKELRLRGIIDKIHDAIDKCKHDEMSINEGYIGRAFSNKKIFDSSSSYYSETLKSIKKYSQKMKEKGYEEVKFPVSHKDAKLPTVDPNSMHSLSELKINECEIVITTGDNNYVTTWINHNGYILKYITNFKLLDTKEKAVYRAKENMKNKYYKNVYVLYYNKELNKYKAKSFL